MKMSLLSFAAAILTFSGAHALASTSVETCRISANDTGFRTVETDELGENEDRSRTVYKGFVLTCNNANQQVFLFIGADAQEVASLANSTESLDLEINYSGGGGAGYNGSTRVAAIAGLNRRISVIGYNLTAGGNTQIHR